MVAMSGGVDSSVTAALLDERGYDVVGVTMKIVPDYIENSQEQEGSCCAIDDAKIVAAALDIPHYAVNFKEEFHKKVIDNFVSEYSRGRTPNPCIVCNRLIKFSKLLQRARELDCDYLATGHYARIVKSGDDDKYYLKKGLDQEKDQSYMLYRFNQQQLARIMMPLGEYSKDDVRELAAEYELPIHNKPDSQEICFVPDGDYTKFLDRHFDSPGEPGPIYYVDGEKIGEHEGLYNYTIGQRRGLGISMDHPVYVLEIDSGNNALIVGPREKLSSRGLIAEDVNWIHFDEIPESLQVEVKIRYNDTPVAATVYPGEGGRARIEFSGSRDAVAPGQSAVFYRDDLVLGGGIIEKAINP